MFCPNCGAENSDQANFCTRCGTQIVDNPEMRTPQQYQQPGPPQQGNPQMPRGYYERPDLKETFVHSATSGAGTYAGCCCMNALSNLLCDACE
ncbi:zinc-ribbon domain-containing protein [Nitrospina gracilis]|uniref:zinc-ribbon domain-containing protein n=1 Tax=Nitrospina gracilis TaxID=35801 RepID=UPI001F2AF403|nr:zinc-ribbon domain-containing protein [Nitrospina gracilis]MCF8720205.1 NMD protein affecting ribosome stability and mRNA decay [Nitrospina gracilis Nb-211]